ncbi:hypothetical protein ACE6H2_001740 [Prunus campanulata]
MDQSGGGSSRSQFRDNNFSGGQGSKNVGITDSYNGPGQAGLDCSENTVTADAQAENVGIHGVGNTGPDKGSSCCCIL